MPSLADNSTDVRPASAPPCSGWSEGLRTAFRRPTDLCRYLGIPSESVAGVDESFSMLVPRAFADRMRRGDPTDPLLLQVLPRLAESANDPAFVPDPVGDIDATVEPGLIHKYHGRALLVATGSCAVHCRYCFRRHYPYATAPKGLDTWRPALSLLENDPSITEVILSGGDPLMLVDRQLGALLRRVDAIPHVERIRLHTRLPVVIPSRVTRQFLDTLQDLSSAIVTVVHVNHPNELDTALTRALRRIADSGVTLLNQAVLLAGINDRAETLRELSVKLFQARTLPYYLHRLDRVAGAAHFATSPGLGEDLIESLRATLPGYLVPRYVADTGDSAGKQFLA